MKLKKWLALLLVLGVVISSSVVGYAGSGWEFEYNGDVLPTELGWVRNANGAYTEEVVDGVLHLNDYGNSSYVAYLNHPSMSLPASNEVVIETRVKVDSGDYGQVNFADDQGNYIAVTIYQNKITVWDKSQTFTGSQAIDLSDYAIIRVIKHGTDSWEVFVDGQQVLSGTTFGNDTPNLFYWGNNGTAPNADMYWDYLNISNDGIPSVSSNLVLDIEAQTYDLNAGETVEVDVKLSNATDIYAEDFTVQYDPAAFELVSEVVSDATAYQIFHSDKATAGQARYIVASNGASYGITGDTGLLKLTFKAKNFDGQSEIKVLSGLVADKQGVELTPDCLGKMFTITGGVTDVNGDENFTLGDLSIASYLLASDSSTWGTYTPDVDINGAVETADLSLIVSEILN